MSDITSGTLAELAEQINDLNTGISVLVAYDYDIQPIRMCFKSILGIVVNYLQTCKVFQTKYCSLN